MQLNCTAVIRRKDKAMLSADHDVVLESIDLPNTKEELGNLTYLAVGASTPKIIGAMHHNAIKQGHRLHLVSVTFEVKRPESNEHGHFKTMDDVAQSNYFDIRWISKPVAKEIIQYWYKWLESDDPYADYVDSDMRSDLKTSDHIQLCIQTHPVFLDYLVKQEPFKDVEATLFRFPLNGIGVLCAVLHKIPSNLIGRIHSPTSPKARVLFPKTLRNA